MPKNIDEQVRRQLNSESHFLMAWKKWNIVGEVIVIGFKDTLYGLQFDRQNQEIIRYFQAPKMTFTPLHFKHLSPIETLEKWILDQFKKRVTGWKHSISELENDSEMSILLKEDHLCYTGRYLPWVDAFFYPEDITVTDSSAVVGYDSIQVRLSRRRKISSQVEELPPIPAIKPPASLTEYVRNIETLTWSILTELKSGTVGYELFTSDVLIIWLSELPYRIQFTEKDNQVTIIDAEDWSGANRGFEPNPWPNSILEHLANQIKINQPRGSIRPLSDALLTALQSRHSHVIPD